MTGYQRTRDWRRHHREQRQRKVEGEEGMMLDTDKDVYHTLTVTLGVRANRDPKGRIKSVACTNAWKDRPNTIPKEMRLLRAEIEVPESFFGFEAKVKGKIESRLIEEFEAMVEELSDGS